MDINEFLNSQEIKDLRFDPNKILQLLLLKSIKNELQLKQVLVSLTEINAKLDGKEGNELLYESSLELTVILETINEELRETLLQTLIQVSYPSSST